MTSKSLLSFVPQVSSEASTSGFTNEKVDEIYSGNNMKAPLIMQMGGQGMAQPVVDNVNYAALAEFGISMVTV